MVLDVGEMNLDAMLRGRFRAYGLDEAKGSGYEPLSGQELHIGVIYTDHIRSLLRNY